METLIADVRYAFRSLGRSPLFTTLAVVCLSVGIATNTTLFSCFNAMVLRPLPFPDPDALVYAVDNRPGTENNAGISYQTFVDWREQARSFTGLSATAGRSLSITEGDEPERLFGLLVSASLFPTLGVQPQLGRGFRDDEDRLGAPDVVLLSDALWRRRYGADSGVVNTVISIDGRPTTVVGVMPPRFKFPENAELWMPVGPRLGGEPRQNRSVVLYGRLQPGVTLAQANTELAAISRRLNELHAPTSEFVGRATALRDQFLDAEVKLIVATMFGAVTLVLLIACANVANLMLARATSRQREIAVRAAIGAGRGRIVRQLLTESLVLASVAAVVALPLTWAGLKLIDRGIPPEQPLPWYFQWGLDTETLLYTLLIAVVTSVVFGLAPALQVSRGRVYDALRDGGGRGAMGSARKNKLRSALVVAEVALSLVLLVGASLFARTFLGLQQTEIGFDTSKILTMRFHLPGARYDSASAIIARVNDIVRRVEALPNVEAAAASNFIPIASGTPQGTLLIEGQPVEPGREPMFRWTGVGGNWFETFGMPIVAGRDFTDTEREGGGFPVAVVSQEFADRFFPGGNALGQQFRMTPNDPMPWQIVGIVPTVRTTSLSNTGAPPPIAYYPYRFLPARNTALIVRVRSGNPTAVTNAVRNAVRESDPSLPVFSVQTMDKATSLTFWQYGLFYKMFGVFGIIALLLASIGVYGVISYSVSQRTQEIGVRVALGARARDVSRMVLREAAWLAGIGVVIGIAGAFAVTRVISSLLIGVSPTDPLSFGAVALFLTLVALVASYVPARRATRVDPLVALRSE